MIRRTSRRNAWGSSIIETVVGCIFLVPVALFLFDCGVLVLAQTENDRLAKACARAAADQADYNSAQKAAQSLYSTESNRVKGYINFLTPPASGCEVIQNGGSWQGNITVTVKTTIKVNLPVPIPFVDLQKKLTFCAQSTEPVVGVLGTS